MLCEIVRCEMLCHVVRLKLGFDGLTYFLFLCSFFSYHLNLQYQSIGGQSVNHFFKEM